MQGGASIYVPRAKFRPTSRATPWSRHGDTPEQSRRAFLPSTRAASETRSVEPSGGGTLDRRRPWHVRYSGGLRPRRRGRASPWRQQEQISHQPMPREEAPRAGAIAAVARAGLRARTEVTVDSCLGRGASSGPEEDMGRHGGASERSRSRRPLSPRWRTCGCGRRCVSAARIARTAARSFSRST